MWARICSDELSGRLQAAKVLAPLADIFATPYRLTRDERGLALVVQTTLTAQLGPAAEQLLRIAKALDPTSRGAPYR